MIFLVGNVGSPFKFSLANFATKYIQASQIFLLPWKAIAICHGVKEYSHLASADRKLFKIYFHLRFDDNINPDVDVTYRTRNLHSLYEKRFIYFISDVPHLLKTTWNCLYISGSGKYTRYMWKSGMFFMEPYC